jgi:transcriptional regulator with XRE-family HTH domain
MSTQQNVTPIRWRPEVSLGTRLRLVRTNCGERIGRGKMKQDEMAELIGVSASAYKQWEADNNRPGDPVDLALRIYEATGVDPAWLLGIPDPDPVPGLDVRHSGCMEDDAGHLAEVYELALTG